MFIFMISISIGPDAGVNFPNARTRSNVSSQRVSELLCYWVGFSDTRVNIRSHRVAVDKSKLVIE